jgi:hypothetical protein
VLPSNLTKKIGHAHQVLVLITLTVASTTVGTKVWHKLPTVNSLVVIFLYHMQQVQCALSGTARRLLQDYRYTGIVVSSGLALRLNTVHTNINKKY